MAEQHTEVTYQAKIENSDAEKMLVAQIPYYWGQVSISIGRAEEGLTLTDADIQSNIEYVEALGKYLHELFGNENGIGGYREYKKLQYDLGDLTVYYKNESIANTIHYMDISDDPVVYTFGDKRLTNIANITIDRNFSHTNRKPFLQRRFSLCIDDEGNLAKVVRGQNGYEMQEFETWELLTTYKLAQASRIKNFRSIESINDLALNDTLVYRNNASGYGFAPTEMHKAAERAGINLPFKERFLNADYVSPEDLIEMITAKGKSMGEDFERILAELSSNSRLFILDVAFQPTKPGVFPPMGKFPLQLFIDDLPKHIPDFWQYAPTQTNTSGE